METNALTPALLQTLRKKQPHPVVSVSMPTHRREPDNAQDSVRLRNLMTEAGRRIDADESVSRQVRVGLKAQLDRALAEVDLRYSLDGLVIFAGTDEYQIWVLERAVPERVVVSDSYLTRNLVAARAQARPYWVLAVAATRATLWHGSGETVREHTGNTFPVTPDELQNDPQREERVGDVASTFQDEETRRFLREVDTALGAILTAVPRPLYVVGLAPALSLLEDVGTATRNAAGKVLTGGMVNGPAYELHKELEPSLAEFQRRTAERTADRLDAARGRRTFAAGLDEVWEAVREGRAAFVAVEEGFQQTVRVKEGHLAPADPAEHESQAPDDGIVREDIVDELVELALDSGAEVAFVPDGTLADHQHIAAELRY
ncbi:chemotaxis protein [Streptomyces sp. NBC_01387]|uniref:baeRF3 domain-containing protein n=1 Tax=unclassified Streptomyces TaxID=2593676 RepID=UPI002024DCB0|nr:MULTISPECIES: chemotaxis protein [unclassified Streptomyces]MCX4552664.1 chemotaxis protein [Streptomyces sp. NBC_01500]WSC24004.1 chemotaxis protein [Streptomyces sp. NBC_01766]WSV57887.1 chemotaxis protein [Streptomyces sp. NBC_01014]